MSPQLLATIEPTDPALLDAAWAVIQRHARDTEDARTLGEMLGVIA